MNKHRVNERPRNGMPIHNHTPAKARQRPREICVQPQPSKAKTKIEVSLCKTTGQKRQAKDQGKPKDDHGSPHIWAASNKL